MGQTRLMTLKQKIAVVGQPNPVIATGDPSIVDFEVLPNPRLIRLYGMRPGVTDFSITTSDAETYSFKVHVVYDLDLLRARLKQLFPETSLNLGQLRDHVVVEGNADSVRQVTSIIEVIRAFLESAQAERQLSGRDSQPAAELGGQRPGPGQTLDARDPARPAQAGAEVGSRPDVRVTRPEARIINLIRVPFAYDLEILDLRLQELYRDAHIEMSQLRGTVIVRGEARDGGQVEHILKTIAAFLGKTVTIPDSRSPEAQQDPRYATSLPYVQANQSYAAANQSLADYNQFRTDGNQQAGQSTILQSGQPVAPQTPVQIINLLRVPGPQQVLLKVQIAELNRTALRRIGTDILFSNSGNILGTQITGAAQVQNFPVSISQANGSPLAATLLTGPGSALTAFGVFEGLHFQTFLAALRQNQLLKVLAEPNLVAMNGHKARFLAGGEFPVPVPQGLGTVGIEYRPFGVTLEFVPQIVRGDTIRLSVTPSVSSLNDAVGTVIQGSLVRGLISRSAQTTVELREGQTLMIAGLLQINTDATNNQIPGLESLPIAGWFFKSSTTRTEERELVIMVTPYLIEGHTAQNVYPLPGDDVQEPTDLELYLYHRLEGCTGQDFRSTTYRNEPTCCLKVIELEQSFIRGPVGYTEYVERQ